MSNPIGDDAQSARNEEECEGEQLCLKIKAQLEDLFSDSHLAEDGFLLKHVQRNKEGYVSLKLLTGLRKIKVLTRDWHKTRAAAFHSQLLEVNDERTKVRRKEPLPRWLLCSPNTRSLLCLNICEEEDGKDSAAQGLERRSLSERILQKFSAYGSVTSVWILPAGQELPTELKCYSKRHSELGQHLCAVVKFDHFEAVRAAYSSLKAEQEKSNGEGMCVVPLGLRSMHHVTSDQSTEGNNQEHPGKSQEAPLETSEDSVQEESSSPVKVSDKTPDTSEPPESVDNSSQRSCEQSSTSCDGPSFTGLNQRYRRVSWCCGDCDKDNSQAPWVLRRKAAAKALNPNVARHLNLLCLQIVLRQPFGPDGTKGFRGRGRPLEQGTSSALDVLTPSVSSNRGRLAEPQSNSGI